jgi:hypothetical protein
MGENALIRVLKKKTWAALCLGTMLAPGLALAQGYPASWNAKDGRWNDWKLGSFATSEAHYNALKAAAKGGVQHTVNTIPDWSGLFTRADGPGGGVPVFQNRPGTPQVPPARAGDPQPEMPVLTPAYQAKLEEELARVAQGIEWDYLSYCLPAGFPRWYTEPFLREFITTPKQTWMILEQQSEARRIYTDGRGHIPEDERYPLWDGDSIGFWDGDTLVIHTVNVKEGMWTRRRPWYSEKMETVELVRKVDPDTIETRMTAYDPESLQKPWHLVWRSARVKTDKAADLRINMWSCNENNNTVKTAEGITQFVLPGEPGYKDPKTFALKPPAEAQQ